jgi:geranyl-CoA carboxylase alpha subunit
VKQGDTLMVLEAMKMEHPVRADRDGVIRELFASAGDQVKRNQLLAEVENEESPGNDPDS